jgi:hypothetical protein
MKLKEGCTGRGRHLGGTSASLGLQENCYLFSGIVKDISSIPMFRSLIGVNSRAVGLIGVWNLSGECSNPIDSKSGALSIELREFDTQEIYSPPEHGLTNQALMKNHDKTTDKIT